ncbi:MAG TPA: ATP-binding protein [bacterium]|nr:ATP-binding protein [bacterium]
MSVVPFPGTPAAPLNDDLQSDLLMDCQNLANECQGLLRSLETYAFPNTGLFIPEQYEQFFRNRKVPEYLDWLRQLANKVHGLKGVLGFLIPEGKRLCHHAEEIIKPLAQAQFVLDDQLHGLLTRFIYEIGGMLETYARQPGKALDLGDWDERIERARAEAAAFVEQSAGRVLAFFTARARDDGAIRRRDHIVQVSVSRDGYEDLAAHVHELYGVVAALGQGATLQRASRLYNRFLDQHQRIKKLPLDVTRYERLVPSLAEKYGLRARFVHLDAGVRADHEFWSAVHEIANHILKNAIVHGIEPPIERLRQDKDEVGSIALELSEDLLGVEVVMADDGRGIDPERIGHKAVEAGIVTAERLAAMSSDEVLGLVFEQGVSTKEDVDDNAGRGIGMGAVREAMRRHQGSYAIESEPGRGTRWAFRFPKTNVSLPCFVTRIGTYPLVVPEAHIRFFAAYESRHVTHLQGRPVYQLGELLVPLVDYGTLFAADIQPDATRPRQLMVVQDGPAPFGLVINEVVDKGILPVHPLGEEVGSRALFIGATLHDARPAMILAVRALGTGLEDAPPALA